VAAAGILVVRAIVVVLERKKPVEAPGAPELPRPVSYALDDRRDP
jgi:hypothetical protein